MSDDLRPSFEAFARARRPSSAEVARVLRQVRKARAQRSPRGALWLFALGGWGLAAVCLVLLLRRGDEASAIAGDPDRTSPRADVVAQLANEPVASGTMPPPVASDAVEPPVAVVAPSSSAVPEPVAVARAAVAPVKAARVARAAPRDSAPQPMVALVTSASAAPGGTSRLTPAQSLTLARGHQHRVESLSDVVREAGMGTLFASEQRCFAELHQKLWVQQLSAREQVRRMEDAVQQADTLNADLQLERLVATRRAADELYLASRACLGAP